MPWNSQLSSFLSASLHTRNSDRFGPSLQQLRPARPRDYHVTIKLAHATNTDDAETGLIDPKLAACIPGEASRRIGDPREGASFTDLSDASPMQTEFKGPKARGRSAELKNSSKAARSQEPLVKEPSWSKPRPCLSTPSDELLFALGNLGQIYARPEQYSNKVDLSFIGPMSIAINKSKTLLKRNEILRERRKAAAGRAKGARAQQRFKKRLPSFLAKYMELVNTVVGVDFPPRSMVKIRKIVGTWSSAGNYKRILKIVDLWISNNVDASFLTAFNNRSLAWLRRQGYDITDLITWEWILTAGTSEQAARRLTMVANQSDSKLSAVKPVPTFVFLFLLRRRDIGARSLRLLLEHAWDRLTDQGVAGFNCSPMHSKTAAGKRPLYQKMSEPTIVLMIIRFLRQARMVWPAAMVNISTMMKFINGTGIGNESPSKVPLSEQTSARMAFLYNRMLSLLALPSRMSPFRSMIHQQRAQFIVLKLMNEFRPSLTVTREGYRAVTAVQLAHMKTRRERKWATMKALSWPPWKEEKLGIDRDIGPEYGRSRASESLWRAREAGYPLRSWEDAAEVLAGWDTDGSPTIQTRAILRRGTFFRVALKRGAASATQVEDNTVVWAARVRATRTVDESWACFLAYKSQNVVRPSQAVYHAMFEKLTFEAKRVKHQLRVGSGTSVNNSNVEPLPGDGKETFPIPSPQEAIYVREPTPTVPGLFAMMLRDQIKPSGRLLGLLWNHASSFYQGIEYLRESSLKFSTMQALLGQGTIQPETTRAELELMEDHLFADFINLLSRFAPAVKARSRGLRYNPAKPPLSTILAPSAPIAPKAELIPQRTQINPLFQAFQLIEIRKPYYRPPWNSLLGVLASPLTVVSSFQGHDLNVQRLLSWKAMCYLLQHMQEIGLEIDFPGFQFLCTGLEKAILASRKLLDATKLPALFTDRTEFTWSRIEGGQWSYHTKLEAEQVLAAGVETVKKHFKRLVEAKSGSGYLNPPASELFQKPDPANANTELPKLLEVPNSSQLHVFIRLLGFCEDYVGLLDLVQWMSCCAPELEAVAEGQVNGRKFRRCVIAIRVFLERSWLSVDDKEEDRDGGPNKHEAGEGAPQEIFHQIFALVDENEAWGGWPTDDEVTVYCCKSDRFS